MSRDDILRMACKAGLRPYHAAFVDVERFAALVAGAEREACAKAVEVKVDRWASVDDNTASVLQAAAAAIRARGAA